MPAIRNSAKAIIIRAGAVLAVQHRDALGDWYLMPGGGQHHGETLHAALQRECWEEIGTAITIEAFCGVREYRGRYHEFADHDGDYHQVEFFFACSVPDDYQAQSGSAADHGQIGVVWLPLADLTRYRLYPKLFQTLLAAGLPTGGFGYLGDIN